MSNKILEKLASFKEGQNAYQKEACKTIFCYCWFVIFLSLGLCIIEINIINAINSGALEYTFADNYLFLNISHYTWQSMYFMNFLHKDVLTHLGGNIIGFILGYIVLSLSYYFRAKKELYFPQYYFFWFFLCCLTVFPFFISGVTLLFPGDIHNSVGFSGIVCVVFGATGGMSIYPLYNLLANRKDLPDLKFIFIPLIVWVFAIVGTFGMIFLELIATEPGVNHQAHILGIIIGLVFTFGFDMITRWKRRKAKVDL
ncbi:MAG: rhomboid family intramembrane serine protease [Paludibacter sp.]|nr:rhomboid family intramembrane serine protease [Paludibacter sp.]